ncbi:hypothetical protein Salat_2091500 [Sesamum alatum]|uniref:Uncharacterized protein n=1 Tax=Sesamum alatum TaxID=300844 RepID=A0AAE1Y0G3_9LAMI|nr:hypothetical protein Salat_2091500 [Sesamum alatum]
MPLAGETMVDPKWRFRRDKNRSHMDRSERLDETSRLVVVRQVGSSERRRNRREKVKMVATFRASGRTFNDRSSNARQIQVDRRSAVRWVMRVAEMRRKIFSAAGRRWRRAEFDGAQKCNPADVVLWLKCWRFFHSLLPVELITSSFLPEARRIWWKKNRRGLGAR